MIVFYLALIIVPPLLPAPPEGAAVLGSFVRFSQFVIWSVWWPFVVLSMLAFGRGWCGIMCPEGALAAYASQHGWNRAVPSWMRWGCIPLVAFAGITVLGQLIEVDEKPVSQLLVLGGSTLVAVMVALIYRRNTWVWCRYLCPVSLLFGVFSRLGTMHFRVDHARLQAWRGGGEEAHIKEPCPVQIHLPALSTNRSCLMCFRCVGWRDSIHLQFRAPGEELLRINQADPLFWEVIFLFAGAIGLPLGVFHAEVRELEGAKLVVLLIGSIAVFGAALAGVTWLSARLVFPARRGACTTAELFARIGYLYAPLALFSLFLGLSIPTFEHLAGVGFPPVARDVIRACLLAAGVLWSAWLARRIIGLQTAHRGKAAAAFSVHVVGIGATLAAWIPVLFR
ncbi:MAG: 4Fe-4S binding protein [Deltaproteobacteria bacterium]|nr:4Fe-4S binding protein [Deltaproteobacteria bacterium]